MENVEFGCGRKKNTNFKILAISKIIHLSLVAIVPMEIINKLNNMQKEFIWHGKNPKIKHSIKKY